MTNKAESINLGSAIFIRLLKSNSKTEDLRTAVNTVRQGGKGEKVFPASPRSFRDVPGAPFAYWVSDRIREIFGMFDPVSNECLVASGTGTLDDFRFLRSWWEVSHRPGWYPYAKGGSYAPYYFDHYLMVNWEGNGREMKAWIIVRYGGGHWARNIRSTEHYFRPGLTWPRRTNGLSFRVLPKGCIFADKGPAVFVSRDATETLLSLLAIVNSRAFRVLVELQLARTELAQSFEVGLIQQTPVPTLTAEQQRRLCECARLLWSLRRTLDTTKLTSHSFVVPALLVAKCGNLAERAAAWRQRVVETEERIADLQMEIDECCFNLYEFGPEDRKQALGDAITVGEAGQAGHDDEESEADLERDTQSLAASFVDWLVGVAFGRFDVCLATGERGIPEEPEPFDRLPTCSPGMLTDKKGLPLECAPNGYSLELPDNGVLVEDPGLERDLAAERDIVRRIREVLGVVFVEQATDIEAELCEMLGVRDLRIYLRRPAGFFADHLVRYSKSRRKTPIYWPLSTASGGYTVWVYYPRLDEDTLYTVVNDHVSPRIAEAESRITQLEHERERAEGREATRLATRINELTELLDELKQLRQSLKQVAELPYKPSLDDGVQITAAPLWELFRYKKWRNGLEKTWRELSKGEYDWADLAYAIWPDRVKDKCREDRSLAIAHDLEDLYEGED